MPVLSMFLRSVRFSLLLLSCGCLFSQINVLTQHNDVARTGQNLNETILTPASVSSGNFGKIFSLTVDGVVEAQPLYVSGLSIAGASHNVVFIATEHDSVFAFDADMGGAPLWQASLLDTAHGALTGATSDPATESGCGILNGEYGISGTPVIDRAAGTLYVVSVTYEQSLPIQRLHALDLTTGAEKFSGPKTIAASVPGTGSGSINGTLVFNPNLENQRAGLALVNGTVYVAFGSNCDLSTYHGWLFAYNATTLAQTAVFQPTPNGVESGIWMGAAAPSFDTASGLSRMFITTGNGTYDAVAPYLTNSMDYGDDILRLDLSSGMSVTDAFTPFDQSSLQVTDTDLGSSGTLILPDQPGSYPHLLVEASKGGVIYLVNRDNLGGNSANGNNVVQEIDNQVGPSFGLPAYWNGSVYLWPSVDSLKQFNLTNGLLSAAPVSVSSQVQLKGLGSTPSISANGTQNGIVWSIDSSQTPQALYAHDAKNVASMLWTSTANSTRDSAGQPVKFIVPTVANGQVYVSTLGQVLVYGLLNRAQTITFSAITTQTTGTPLTLIATATSGLPVSFVSSTPAVCTVAGSIVTFISAGSCTISASQSGNGSYAAATPVSRSFTVLANTPVISQVAATGVTSTSVTISWITDQASSSQVNYGMTTAYGSSSTINSSLMTSHSVTLTGLTPNTTYNFDVSSANAAGIAATSANSSFITAASSATPPYVGYVAFWGVNGTGVTISWSTDVLANTQLAYGTTTSLGQTTPVQTAMTNSHGVVLTGLNSGTTYYFVAESTGANGATGHSSTYSFTTTGTASAPAPVISMVVAGAVTGTSAAITWTTDQASSSQVNYGTTTAYGSLSTLNTSLVTSHSVTLTGLNSGTTYYFVAESTGANGTNAISSAYSFTTTGAAPAPAPVISIVTAAGVTSTSATITWTTDQASSSQVSYGTTAAYGSSSTLNTSLVTSHSVTLTGLTANTTYNFDVSSANAGGIAATSPNSTFLTTASSGGPAPYVGYVAFWGVNGSGVTISWSTDVLANTQLAYGTTAALGQTVPVQTALTSSHGVVLTGLNSGTTYYFVAESTSANGVTGSSSTYSFTTTGTAPASAPVISQVITAGQTNTSATISWTTDQASSSQVKYGTTAAYGFSSTLNTSLVTSHSVMLTGLNSGTTYYFVAQSTGANGVTGSSAAYSFTTTGAAPSPAPVISIVTAAGQTTTAAISWTTDQASSSQVNYGTTTAYGSSSTLNTTLVTSHAVTLTGLTASTTYNFDVSSANATGLAATSANSTFVTTASSAGPAPYVGYVAFWGVNSSGVTISWSTDVLANTQLAYGTTTALGQTTPLQTAMTNSHGVVLTGLNSGTTYYFVAQSTGANGVTGSSATYSFTTTSPF